MALYGVTCFLFSLPFFLLLLFLHCVGFCFLFLFKMTYKKYLKSEHWQQKRKETFSYGGYECYVCKSKKRLQVHHKTYKRKGAECVSTDLFALCAKHHLQIHETAKKHDRNIWNATVKIKKDFIEKNGFKWGKREAREYFKNPNGNIKRMFY